MKIQKLNSSTITAVVILIAALVQNAKTLLGKEPVSGCFQTVTLADSDGTDAFKPTSELNNCQGITNTIITNNRRYLVSQPSGKIPGCAPNGAKFCCVFLEPIPTSQERLFPAIGYFDFGTPAEKRKWRVVKVHCQ